MVTRFNDIVIITIHYISMCIHDSIVRSILSEFGEVIAGRFTTYGDNPTVFNGTRQYKMKLTKPIPTVLRIGDRNAWVSYPGQIRTCARCGEQGHYARDCTNTKCFKCLQIGHVAGDCPNQVICTICRMEGHSFRYCPKSFAKAVQPDRAWSSVSSNPSTSSGDQVAIAPDASSKEKGLKELPAGKCLKCKQSAGPFHPSICCFSCKLPLSFSKPFSILECAACKGVNGQPSLVCHRDSCKSVQAPESNDGFRVVRRRKRAAKRSSSPPVQPSTKKATPMPSSTGGGGETAPTAADIFGSDLDSVSSMDSCPARDPKGVRQGCPLSPLLYVVFIEPFAAAVRNDEDIQGIFIPGSNNIQCKIVQYADDTTCIVKQNWFAEPLSASQQNGVALVSRA
ncbi:uncharacterized protein LOC110989509 isoform X4 [Acanthaster planci]|uniref:Uncharacterized protein LOC110989509 isoform X4 n=1 Tax=Acanthaster planci TaxID=133434 RepID=A0A8B7ZVR8_ACAPL|nr:uncharacterized protein LOC110989509 isoform X4 [Acanthaster planci]